MNLALEKNLRINVVSDVAGFDALLTEWETLHAASSASVFQSFTWLRAWWRHLGEGIASCELHIVLIRQHGSLVAIAPFLIQSKKISRLAYQKELRFMGTGISDYMDVILMPGLENTLLRKIASHLGTLWRSIDSINLVEIADESLTRRVLGDELKSYGVGVTVKVCDACPQVELKANWAETLTTLGGKRRRHLQAEFRQLHDNFPIGYECIEDATMLDEALGDFIAMHKQRMAKTGKDGAYADGRLEDFHREVCKEFHKNGWLFLSFLTLGGKRVAAACSYMYKQKTYLHVCGIGEMGDAWRYSPGIVLQCLCIQESIRRGVKTYDFLRGTESYKYRLGAVDFPNWRIEAMRVRTGVRILGAVGNRLGGLRRWSLRHLGTGLQIVSGT